MFYCLIPGEILSSISGPDFVLSEKSQWECLKIITRIVWLLFRSAEDYFLCTKLIICFFRLIQRTSMVMFTFGRSKTDQQEEGIFKNHYYY